MAHIITIGSDQQGSGKTTLAIHLTLQLATQGYRVCSIDVEPKQRSLSHYLENRKRYMVQKNITLPLATTHTIISKGISSPASDSNTEETQCRDFGIYLKDIALKYDFIVIDTQSDISSLARFAHSVAQTIITPYKEYEALHEKPYSTLLHTITKHTPTRWFIVRHCIKDIKTPKKTQDAGRKLGFIPIAGLKERPLYRDLFLRGLVLPDLFEHENNLTPELSHIAARLELKDTITALQLPLTLPSIVD